MKSFYVENEIGRLHYLQVGNGEGVMICFPGFGQSAYTFSRLLSAKVRLRYTFFIVDMFYEGKSELYSEGVLTPECWNDFINGLITQQGLKAYTVLAYSIGARMALSLSSLQSLILIAPDGISNRLLYRLIAQNKRVGDSLTWLSLKFNNITKINKGLWKWTNPKFVFKIAKIWRLLSGLPNLNTDIPTVIYTGTKDIVADNRAIEKWSDSSPNRILYKAEKGHFPLLVYVLRFKI